MQRKMRKRNAAIGATWAHWGYVSEASCAAENARIIAASDAAYAAENAARDAHAADLAAMNAACESVYRTAEEYTVRWQGAAMDAAQDAADNAAQDAAVSAGNAAQDASEAARIEQMRRRWMEAAFVGTVRRYVGTWWNAAMDAAQDAAWEMFYAAENAAHGAGNASRDAAEDTAHNAARDEADDALTDWVYCAARNAALYDEVYNAMVDAGMYEHAAHVYAMNSVYRAADDAADDAACIWNTAEVVLMKQYIATTVHVESTAWGFDEDNGRRGGGVGCSGESTLF
jgi:hypothetical protein